MGSESLNPEPFKIIAYLSYLNWYCCIWYVWSTPDSSADLLPLNLIYPEIMQLPMPNMECQQE